MIDSHCHLDFDAFDGIREEAISQAARAGVGTIINIGVDLISSRRAVDLAATHDAVYATVGVHPHDARLLDDAAYSELKKLASEQKVVAIGETGLDYYRDLSPRSLQQEAFHRQLQLAAELKLPVVIHTRKALGDTLTILEEHARNLQGGVFHCFPGNTDDAYRVFELGFAVGIGGVVTYKNSSMARMAVEIPLEKIILETDAPYLTPVPHRGKTNQPAYVTLVRDNLAQLRGVTPAEIEMITDRTCRKLFGLVEIFGG
jgi:TatD DNase family protein